MGSSPLLGGTLIASAVFFAAGARAADRAADERVRTFTARLNMVSLVVSVTDAHGRPVAGLERQNFTVLEDGQPQDLTLFASEPIPLSLAILVDTSTSMERTLPSARAAAANLLGPLHPGDEAMVAEFTQRHRILQAFTADLPSLARALDALKANGATALYDAVYCTLKEFPEGARGEALRRRAVVLLTDGEDTASLTTEEQALDVARHAGVVVYTIGFGSRPGSPSSEAGMRAAHFLTRLARESGGQAYFTSRLSDLNGVYASIAEELRTQYTLGYVPRNAREDGRWRRIAVTTVPPNLILRYRSGYFGPRERVRMGSR
jgi:Ca-activated chloride channel family protein